MVNVSFTMEDLKPEVREEFEEWVKVKLAPDGEKFITLVNKRAIDPIKFLSVLSQFGEERERKENK